MARELATQQDQRDRGKQNQEKCADPKGGVLDASGASALFDTAVNAIFGWCRRLCSAHSFPTVHLSHHSDSRGLFRRRCAQELEPQFRRREALRAGPRGDGDGLGRSCFLESAHVLDGCRAEPALEVAREVRRALVAHLQRDLADAQSVHEQ